MKPDARETNQLNLKRGGDLHAHVVDAVNCEIEFALFRIYDPAFEIRYSRCQLKAFDVGICGKKELTFPRLTFSIEIFSRPEFWGR